MNPPPTLEDLGLQATAEDPLERGQALGMSRTLDRDDEVLDDGALPLTWIWAFFTPTIPTAALRQDGHPLTRPDGPLAGRDRRMFVGGSLTRRGVLRVGSLTSRASQVLGATTKRGRTGAFVLVEVEHRYRQGGDLVLIERQHLMYRDGLAPPTAAPGAAVAPPTSSGHRQDLRPDERLLFRYSALTFNTHRIHYDLPYARAVEGYPGLVVHGPLTATLLADLAARELGDTLTSFSFRAAAPTFAGVALHLICDGHADGLLRVRAVREDGVEVMTGEATAATRGR